MFQAILCGVEEMPGQKCPSVWARISSTPHKMASNILWHKLRNTLLFPEQVHFLRTSFCPALCLSLHTKREQISRGERDNFSLCKQKIINYLGRPKRVQFQPSLARSFIFGMLQLPQFCVSPNLKQFSEDCREKENRNIFFFFHWKHKVMKRFQKLF